MSDIDFKTRYELWLCDDCVIMIENGDSSGIEYGYDNEREAQTRLDEIEKGESYLSTQGYLGYDHSEETQRECRSCGHVHDESHFERIEETDDEDEKWLCPKCDSDDTDRRESGYMEFSWSECDCCGTTLGGSRTRYSLFPFLKETA